MNMQLSVGFEDDALQSVAQALSDVLNLPMDNNALPRLSVMPDKLVLLVQGFAPLYADFNSKVTSRRREAGKAQGLIRACRPCKGLRIVDATAGWGRDAALLAHFGAEVVMVERHPIMAALLADALKRLHHSNHEALRLSLVCTDAVSYLQSLAPTAYPDVVYIDPMHPERQKSALVKKDMQVLQRLIGMDEDAQTVLQQALCFTRQRVVVKWPQHLPPLGSPNHSIHGKTVRFDIYTRKIPLSKTTEF